VPTAPAVRVQQKAPGRTTGEPNNRPSLRDGFSGCSALSPVHRAFWPPYRDNALTRVARVIPASGYQDHAAWPSATAPVVCTLSTEHDLLGKPLRSFPDHARAPDIAAAIASRVQRSWRSRNAPLV